jgi:DNA-directed RNA polymerase specialized sigma24 family protein
VEPLRAPLPSRLEEWIARHGAELCRHVGRMLGDADEAEDVLQQVWLAAAERPPQDGPASNPRAWLYRVATNAASTASPATGGAAPLWTPAGPGCIRTAAPLRTRRPRT